MVEASEKFDRLLETILADRGHPGRIVEILAESGQSADWFVGLGRSRLRSTLIEGRLDEAEALGQAVAVVLELQDDGFSGELAEHRIHRESMTWLLAGISAIFNQDNLAGIEQLDNLTQAVYCDESLQWIAWYWISRAYVDAGGADKALTAAKKALQLASRLDINARGLSLCNVGEIAFFSGDHASALEYLKGAIQPFEQAGDQRGIANAHLILARIHLASNFHAEATAAALRAERADPNWEAPTVFLARQSLLMGDIVAAERALVPLVERKNPSVAASRDLKLADALKAGRVSQQTVSTYLNLRDAPPSQRVVDELELLIASEPDFLQLRELAGWTLSKLGKNRRAEAYFEGLKVLPLEPELRSSVLLGLGCLANRRNQHRQPPARVHAAALAGRSSQRDASNGGDAADAGPTVRLSRDQINDVDSEIGSDFDLGVDARVTVESGSTTNAELPHVNDSAFSRTTIPADIEAPHDLRTAPTKAAFTGDLQLLNVPDLLEFLKSSRRTGTLLITTDEGTGAVHMRNGSITGAAAPDCESIGDRLCTVGMLTPEQLDTVRSSQRQRHSDRLLGTLLVEEKLITVDQLRSTLLEQVQSVILKMISWTVGEFAFEPDREGVTVDSSVDLEFDTQSILLEALRRFDEENR